MHVNISNYELVAPAIAKNTTKLRANAEVTNRKGRGGPPMVTISDLVGRNVWNGIGVKGLGRIFRLAIGPQKLMGILEKRVNPK